MLVEVDGYLHTKVPRESVYDTELYRILVNWIVNECNFVVTGQHHLIDHVDNDEKGKHYYSDITIMSEDQTAVLELLASATKNELNEHFERILNYAEMLSANDIWIVNFTCEDNATKQPPLATQ
ncbi:P-loop containing nucleoside triphosphate hydrolase protein [Rhizophagus irregularis DAOM 181602=DAOM 197198]|nr:P-loop containing nucleoside triphosphate hydrolase protein [Rhizophagus irregularis DAOM 181602=DAOM 197198]